MTLVLLFTLLLPFETNAQEATPPLALLTTYEDAPGRLTRISPDGLWLVIYDEANNLSRLVEVATGRILAESAQQYSIHFCPDSSCAAYRIDDSMIELIALPEGDLITEFEGDFPQFSADSRYVWVNRRVDARYTTNLTYTTYVVDILTGEGILQVAGIGRAINGQVGWFSVNDSYNLNTHIYDLQTGDLEFSIPIELGENSQNGQADSIFSPDGRQIIVVYPLLQTAAIYSTETWELQYRVEDTTRIGFRVDGRYILANDSDVHDSNHAQLLDAQTGDLIDEIEPGTLTFSHDGLILYRLFDVEMRDTYTIQAVEVATGEVLTEERGFIRLKLVENNQIAEIFDNNSRTTRFIDLTTDQIIWEIEGNASIFDFDRSLLFIHEFNNNRLINADTGEVYITAEQLFASPIEGFIFASREGYVELYGAPDARLDEMPTPRP
jgi:WD40 repeat protein